VRDPLKLKSKWQPPPAVFKQLNDEFMLHLR